MRIFCRRKKSFVRRSWCSPFCLGVQLYSDIQADGIGFLFAGWALIDSGSVFLVFLSVIWGIYTPPRVVIVLKGMAPVTVEYDILKAKYERLDYTCGHGSADKKIQCLVI